MKLNISKAELAEALSIVSRATSNRPTIPILSGILIQATGDQIRFYGTDLETSIQSEVDGLVEQEGSTVVPGKVFGDIIRSLPDSSVLLEKAGDSLAIKAHQTNFTIRTLPAEDFAKFPEIKGTESIELPTKALEGMVRKVGKAVSRDETRAVLTGILVQIGEGIIKMVATDSYRLAIVEGKLEGEDKNTQFEALIPGKAFEDVIKMAPKNGSIKITLTSNQVRFEFDKTVFVTRRIEGNYPNYKNLLPDHYNLKINLSQEEMLEATKRVALMAVSNTAIKLSISTEDSAMVMSSHSNDYGQAEEAIIVKTEGEDREISANHTYLPDGLSVIGSEFITLEIQEAMKPGIIRSEEEGFVYLFMPVRPS
jgi:DNA polymerase-3 subunit beta